MISSPGGARSLLKKRLLFFRVSLKNFTIVKLAKHAKSTENILVQTIDFISKISLNKYFLHENLICLKKFWINIFRTIPVENFQNVWALLNKRTKITEQTSVCED